MPDHERTLSVDEARSLYDRIGSRQDWNWFYEDRGVGVMIERADFANAHSIVEFGCGTARIAEKVLSDYAAPDCYYLGLDVSAKMTALAHQRMLRFTDRADIVMTNGSTKLSVPDQSFDRFVSTYVFDLMSREQILEIVAEAKRVLVPGGLMCVVSLTHGRSAVPKLFSSMWNWVHATGPVLVGGCRPIELMEFIPHAEWRVDHLEVVSAFGLSSEVMIASPR